MCLCSPRKVDNAPSSPRISVAQAKKKKVDASSTKKKYVHSENCSQDGHSDSSRWMLQVEKIPHKQGKGKKISMPIVNCVNY